MTDNELLLNDGDITKIERQMGIKGFANTWTNSVISELLKDRRSLITTIESQKSEIAGYKAITELAVKTLNDVLNEDFTFPPGRSQFIRDRLLEIERLGGEVT